MAKNKTAATKRSVGSRKYDCPIESGEVGPTDVACPECGAGHIVPGRGRFGLIWQCSEKTACKFWLRARPTGDACDYRKTSRSKPCGQLMMDGTKTIPTRCSDRDCPNHHPHKLAKK